MAIWIKGAAAHLEGNLTNSGVTHSSIDSLTVSLQQIESGGKKIIRIDCRRILSADISGLQLLYVWMQCARFRGVEPELVNLSAGLQQAIQRLGVGHCFTGNSSKPETAALRCAASGLGKNHFRAEYVETC